MKYILFITTLISLLIGCSATKEIREATTNNQLEEVDNPKEKAMEHFLKGSTAEQQGDYETAVLEYQNALKYDISSGIYYALAKSYLATNKL
jgi:tetratricopeptide (TPR) repeat protein